MVPSPSQQSPAKGPGRVSPMLGLLPCVRLGSPLPRRSECPLEVRCQLRGGPQPGQQPAEPRELGDQCPLPTSAARLPRLALLPFLPWPVGSAARLQSLCASPGLSWP